MEKEKISYPLMCEQIRKMAKEELERHWRELGCTWSYEEVVAALKRTWNDLSVGDSIFESCTIDASKAPYDAAFIDEAVLEICRREPFAFVHYGRISSCMEQLMRGKDMEEKAWLQEMETLFSSLFQLAAAFKIVSIEALLYQAGDTFDLVGAIALYLDRMMQHGREDASFYGKVIDFCEQMLSVFPKTGYDISSMLYYEQASACIAIRSPKGERIFQKLLKTAPDKTDVVLHYGLAYLDEDEKRTLRIFKRYERLLDKSSDAYEIIREIQKEAKCRS